MYETISYESILQRMLDRIPGNLNKREGSIIYEALAPAASEIMLMYLEFNTILTETFADTASREYLILRAKERGIEPYPSTQAILKGEFTPSTLEISIGSRFSLNELNYVVISKTSNGIYQMRCEEFGVKGNQYFGEMIPIEYVDGLQTAKLTELLIPGEDEEGTEDLRIRYFSSFETKPYGGNKKDYMDKTNAIAGVGSTKVTPIWNGGGTVKLTILNSNFDKASSTLVETVQEAIDPTKDGQGLGVAPIGHIVTVATVEEIPINIQSIIVFEDGYSFSQLKTQIEAVVGEYLLELRKDWANSNSLIVRTVQIETRVLGIVGVVDIGNTTINLSPSNLTLTEFQVPIIGGVIA